MSNEAIELLEPFEEIGEKKEEKILRPGKEYWTIVLLTIIVIIILTIMIMNKK